VVLGELGNFPLLGLIWGTVVVLGGFGGVRQFSFIGVDLGHCVGGFWKSGNFHGSWFWVVLGELGNFPLWGVDLGHCVGGFGWFWGS
jgi:hypothetical protein